MRKLIIPALCLATGTALGYGLMWYRMSNELMSSLYMDEATRINIYVALLNAEKQGKHDQVVEWLERYLNTSELILSGCKKDICKSERLPQVEEALSLANGYEYTQYHPEKDSVSTHGIKP